MLYLDDFFAMPRTYSPFNSGTQLSDGDLVCSFGRCLHDHCAHVPCVYIYAFHDVHKRGDTLYGWGASDGHGNVLVHPFSEFETQQDALDALNAAGYDDPSNFVEAPKIRCCRCGWTGSEGDLKHVSVREDFGDYETDACPNCGSTIYDGMEFEDVFEVVG